MLENHFGRILLSAQTLVVCPRSGPGFAFANQFQARMSSSPAGGPTLVALNRDRVLYVDEGDGGDLNGDDQSVVTVSLRTRRQRVLYRSSDAGGAGHPVLGSAVLCRNGRVAFIGGHVSPLDGSVHLAVSITSGYDARLLSRAAAIVGDSLRASDRRVTWREGSIPRDHRVDCPSPRRAVLAPPFTADGANGISGND